MTQKARTELSVAAIMASALFATFLLISARAAAMHVQSAADPGAAVSRANP